MRVCVVAAGLERRRRRSGAGRWAGEVSERAAASEPDERSGAKGPPPFGKLTAARAESRAASEAAGDLGATPPDQ